VALTLYTVRPTLPWRWAVPGALVLLMGFSQVYDSLALGQVDATIVLLLAIGLWGYRARRPAVTGTALALATAIKIVPGLLLLYFLWKREYRTVLWGAGVGLVLLLLSLPVAGFDTYWTYASDTVPSLAKGSAYYANVSVVGAITRAFVDGPLGGLRPLDSFEEVPALVAARVWSLLAEAAILAGLALAVGRQRQPRANSGDALSPLRPELVEGTQGYVIEYYLVVAAGLLISSVTWESYLVWLLPLFLAAFLAPSRVLPGGRKRLAALAALGVAYLALNYPGDLYPFDVNGLFYHPSWVPGVWVEDRLQLYHRHLAVIPALRLAALALLALTLAAVTVSGRRRPAAQASD